MKVLGIIPARNASTRVPSKPLTQIAGQSLIQRVVEQCRKVKSSSEVIVATDDTRIRAAVQDFCRVEMTCADHPSGSGRIAEISPGRSECDAVVNIQGDEPPIDPLVVDAVAMALSENEMSTTATSIRGVSVNDNANIVKVVVNAAGCAL